MAELTVPQINFAPLGQLGNVYRKAQEDQMRQQTLASLGQGTDLDANALLKSGDLSLAQLGVAMRNRSSDDIWRQQEAQRTQKNADRSFGLQQQQFVENQDYTPEELDQRRRAQLKAAGVNPSTPEGQAFLLSGSWSGPGTNEASLNPVYGVGGDGKPAMVQTTKSGKAIQTQLPEGFQISKEPVKIDAGTHYNLLDPQTRQIVGTIPKNVAEVERQKVAGDEQAKAQVALPQVIATSQQILKNISEVKNHPGKDWSLGMYSKVPTIPGTPQADFRTRLGQLQGQTFLQAYNTLKGGGAITDIEGAKATSALNRMNTVTSKEEFDKAADDFADVVKGGMLRASAKARAPAGGGVSQEPQPQAQPSKPVVVDGYTIKEN